MFFLLGQAGQSFWFALFGLLVWVGFYLFIFYCYYCTISSIHTAGKKWSTGKYKITQLARAWCDKCELFLEEPVLVAGGRREIPGAGGCPHGPKESLPGLTEALTPALNAWSIAHPCSIWLNRAWIAIWINPITSLSLQISYFSTNIHHGPPETEEYQSPVMPLGLAS